MNLNLVWKAIERNRNAHAARWLPAIRKQFQQEQEAILRVLASDISAAAALSKLRNIEAEWSGLFVSMWKDVSVRVGTSVAKRLGARVKAQTWTYDPWGAAYRRAVMTFIGKKVTRVAATTRQKVAKVIGDLPPNATMEDAAKALKRAYRRFTTKRALTIARTETAAAANYATHYVVSMSGLITTKTWITCDDDRVRDTHDELHEMTIGIDDLFPNGCLFPCDPNGAPREVINCRCHLAYGVGELTSYTPPAP